MMTNPTHRTGPRPPPPPPPITPDDAPIYIIDGELSELDVYEPEFFYPEEAWLTKNYTVNLTVTDATVTEIFYFCHIHNAMSGR